MSDYPQHMLDTAQQLADDARRLLPQVLELAEGLERLYWERTAHELGDHPDDQWFQDVTLVSQTALSAMRLKISERENGQGSITPHVMDRLWPGLMPEYERLHHLDLRRDNAAFRQLGEDAVR